MATELTALVVGASRGLGFALVDEWLKRGARVIATVRRRSEELGALQSTKKASMFAVIIGKGSKQ
jgi:NAD(P)-dependent dehydrogenase (short-subunit alcohol dehydrogenase family)